MQIQELLKSLHLKNTNLGASFGEKHWLPSNLGELISVNPNTCDPIAGTTRADIKEYEMIIQESHNAFLKWRTVPAPKRGELIRAIGTELREQKELLGRLVSLEMGKSFQEGLGEVQEMIDMADLAVGQSRMLYGYTMHSERAEHRIYEQWHPLGVTAVISAFNFPVAVWAWNAFLAVICGNTVIWKPSPKTSLCAVAVIHICNRVMAQFNYEAIFSLCCSDDPALVKHIAEDSRVALISFTGSTAVGREINTTAAKRFAKVILELSGNNAIILDETANLKIAIPAIVFGAVGTAGQRCTTTRRLFIHESIYEITIQALQSAYRSITIGDPLDEKNLMGPLIDAKAVAAYTQAIMDAKHQGGNILHGGHILDHAGFFVEPTLIEAKNHFEIVQRETFAPILFVIKYQNFSDALEMQNQSHFGLSSALFTENLSRSEYFLSAKGSDCGIANINIGTSGAEIGGAFGGEKDTGGGREAGSDAWKAYMRRQTNTINWSSSIAFAQGIRFEI